MADQTIPESSEESKARHTPGPFFKVKDASHNKGPDALCREGIGHPVAVLTSRLDEAERIELIDLLNKGTHFDEMLAELKRYHQAAEGVWNELVAQGGNEELVQSGRESLDATAALIAKAEGRDD